MHGFALELNGVRYHATWRCQDGRIEVRSDYGGRIEPLRGRNPSTAAREVLAAMIPSADRWGTISRRRSA